MPIKSEDGLGSASPRRVTLLRLKAVCFHRKTGKQAEHGEGVRVNADGAAIRIHSFNHVNLQPPSLSQQLSHTSILISC